MDYKIFWRRAHGRKCPQFQLSETPVARPARAAGAHVITRQARENRGARRYCHAVLALCWRRTHRVQAGERERALEVKKAFAVVALAQSPVLETRVSRGESEL